MLLDSAIAHILCESSNFEYKECPAGGKVNRIVNIHRQMSGSEDCIAGRTFGSRGKDYVWVDGGCRAVFIVVLDGMCAFSVL